MIRIENDTNLTNAIALLRSAVSGKSLSFSNVIGATTIGDLKLIAEEVNGYLKEKQVNIQFEIKPGRKVLVDNPEELESAIGDMFPLVGGNVYGNYTLRYCWMVIVQEKIDRM